MSNNQIDSKLLPNGGDAASLKSATTSISIGSATAPSAGQVLTATSGTEATWQTPAGGTSYVAILQDQKSQNTAAQSIGASSWVTRNLNTEVCDPGNYVSVSADQFTLTAGNYLIEWFPSIRFNGAWGTSSSRLYNVSDATAVAYGNSTYQQYGSYTQYGAAQVSIGTSKTYRVEQYTDVSGVSGGYTSNFGTEVYLTVRITKLG